MKSFLLLNYLNFEHSLYFWHLFDQMHFLFTPIRSYNVFIIIYYSFTSAFTFVTSADCGQPANQSCVPFSFRFQIISTYGKYMENR